MAGRRTFKVLLQRDLLLKDQRTGSKALLKVLIGFPRWMSKGKEAVCPVAIEGSIRRVEDIRGVDPMQAIELALAFVNYYIRNLPPNQKIAWPDGEPYDTGPVDR